MDWRFSTFIVSLFALLIGISWGTSENGFCSSEFVKDVLAEHTKDGALNCFDFWLNRYQTLFGVLAATIAAGLAWAGVQKQIDVAARQTSASMIKVINDRLAASQRLRTCVAVIEAYDHFSFDALKECIDIVEMLKSAAEMDDDAFGLMLNSDLVPAVEEYSECVQKIRDSAERGKNEIEHAIVVGTTRVETEEYFMTAVLLTTFHDQKLRLLNRFCEFQQREDGGRGKSIARFHEVISRGSDRVVFRFLPAYKSTEALVERLSELLEATVKKAEEALIEK